MVKLMGCFFVKPVDDGGESPKDIRVKRVNSLRRKESFMSKTREKKVGLVDKKLNGSKKVRDVTNSQKITDNIDKVVCANPEIEVVPIAWELVAAGWPSWLASVASEAINGWVPRRADTFEKIDKIGQGTYSSVYKARDLTHDKIVALKRVKFDNMDPESVKFMSREILILRRLDHPNVTKLEGLVIASSSLYLVFEYMEHDLTGLASLPDSKFSEPQVKCYMKQLLSGLDHCHSRGILHRDIKGSNLLIGENGILKIADFGLAAFFDRNQSLPLTSRVVTLWYRPPELLLGATYYGVSVDLWSAGCILGELYANKPIMTGTTEVEQLHKIFKLCGSPSEEYWAKANLPNSTGFKPLQPYKRRLSESFKSFPAVALKLMEILLAIDPNHRGTAADALKSELFTTEPLPCDPSSLPKYAPSKEMDVKLREEESRRQRMGGSRGPRADQESEGPKSSRASLAPNANAKLVAAIQRRQCTPGSSSHIDIFSPNQLEKQPRKDVVNHDSRRITQSGPIVPGTGWAKSDDGPVAPVKANLSTSSHLVALRISEDSQKRLGIPIMPLGSVGPTRKNDRLFIHQNMAGFRDTIKGRAESNEPALGNNGMKKNKIHNVDQMLKENDRQIQEAARRARMKRAR